MKLTTLLIDGDYYIRTTPAKALMQSTMVYEVVTRGSVFCTRLRDGKLTVFPSSQAVIPFTVNVPLEDPKSELFTK